MIFFDNIVFSLQRAGGVSIVWKELISRIIRSDFSCCFVEYEGRENNIFRNKIDIPKEKIIKKSSFMLRIKRYLNPKIKEDFPFVFHSTYYRYCRNKNAINITTVHDFTYEYYTRGLQKWVHCRQKHAAIRNSDYVICISETTKRDLLKFLPDTNPEKIQVIYNGVSDEYCVLPKIEIEKTQQRYGNFALFVGFRSGYKNFENAVLSVKNTDLNLLIVGGELTKAEKLFVTNELGENRFFALTRIPNNELNVLYNAAHCLLYLSLYEGFGIPVLEAQRAGCPVVALNVPSVAEIIGDKQMLVQKNSAKEIVEKINSLNNIETRNTVISLGLENAKKFSWDKTAEETFDLYKKIEKRIETR